MSSEGKAATLDLKWQVEDIGPCRKKLIVEVAASEVNRALEKSCSALAGDVQIPGFRKGRAPRDLVEKRFAAEISKEVAEALVPEAIDQSCKAASLDIISAPRFDRDKIRLRKGEPLKFEVEVEVKPEFILGQYKGVEINQLEAVVFDEELDAVVREALIEAGHVSIEEPMEATPDCEIFGTTRVEAEGFDESYLTRATIEDGLTLGPPVAVPVDMLIGKKTGDTVEYEMIAGEECQASALRGKKVKISFRINKIIRQKSKELTDEIAREFGEPDAAAFREKLRSKFMEVIAEKSKTRAEEELLEKITAATPFEVPRGAVERYKEFVLSALDRVIRRLRTDERYDNEDTDETISKLAEADSERIVRQTFILEKIAKVENITVEDDEVDAELAAMARARGVRASDLFRQMSENGDLEAVKWKILRRKTIDFLMRNANITVVPRKRNGDVADTGPSATAPVAGGGPAAETGASGPVPPGAVEVGGTTGSDGAPAPTGEVAGDRIDSTSGHAGSSGAKTEQASEDGAPVTGGDNRDDTGTPPATGEGDARRAREDAPEGT
ncbi:MAG: trigger factor [Planctomycetota bacterium]|nr:trigger factor [Planctomycetota bacterium]